MFEFLEGVAKGIPKMAIWITPIMGVVACGLAYAIGRRLMIGTTRPVDSKDPVAEASSIVLAGVTRDRRAAPRRKGNIVELELSLGEEHPPIRGWVVNRSAGGLCVLTEQAIAADTIVRVRPRRTLESLPWTDVTVRSCRPDGGNFELGCQFHRMPTWHTLLQFG